MLPNFFLVACKMSNLFKLFFFKPTDLKKHRSLEPEFRVYLYRHSCRQEPCGIFESAWCLTVVDFISAFLHP